MKKHLALLALVTCGTLCLAQSATEIIQASGVKGGIVIHIGCGDGALTAGLRVNDSFLVQGLDTDSGNVQKARAALLEAGVTGAVSVVQFDGKALPYIDNLANLVVAADLGGVPMAEVTRVLAPHGVAYIKTGGAWTRTVKPVPADTDEWTHYLHDPDNNAVSRDQQIHPPKYLQWVGSPRYSRHHDHMSVVSACVTSGGRIYHLMDEATRYSIFLRPVWKLVGRDAFNGMILWKREVSEWYTHMHRLKSGPAYLPRKLVAVGDILYASLGLHEPLSVIDGATGKTLRTYLPEMATDEILYDEGVLYLVGSAEESTTPQVDVRAIRGQAPRRVVAVNAETGAVLWETTTKILPVTLTVSGGQVYLHDTETLVALNAKTGKPMWKSEPLPYFKQMHPLFAPTLVAYKDVVFFAGGEGFKMHRSSRDEMVALSAKDGKTLWRAEHPPSGYQSPEDVLVVDGLVWCAETTSGRQSGELIGGDPWTGEEKSRFPANVETYWFHHRCYRAKATDNYFLMSRTGIEFVDYRNENWIINHWVRGACLYGVMPANGLLYSPQHPCACYPEAKLSGFNALSSHRDLAGRAPAVRLRKGPAYAAASGIVAAARPATDAWPTFRANAARSSSVSTPVRDDIEKAWTADIGGRLSQPVVADGRLYVVQVDEHTLHVLDAGSGKPLWRFVAGARIDSAPTVYKGLVLFGANDGRVYCLRADTGESVWTFLAASSDHRHVAFEQLESVWPVPGNVLIQDDVAYFAAGRNIFLDGGLLIYRLNPVTGEMLSKTEMTDVDPDGKPIQDYIDWLNMPVGKPDILSSDGKRVYMLSQAFDMDGKRTRVDRLDIKVQRGEEAHLFCPSGFLDDSWWHRTYQVFGRSFSGGHSGYHQAGKLTPSGKLMVFDDTDIYAFARKPQYYKWTTPIEHQLYRVDKKQVTATEGEVKTAVAAPKAGKGRAAANQPMINIPNSDSLDPVGKALVVEAWVNAGAPNGVILARGGPANGYALVLEEGKPQFIIRTDGGVYKVSAFEEVVGGWRHVAGVLTAEHQLEIYVDGRPDGKGKSYGLISALPVQETQIGGDDGGGVGEYQSPALLKGAIDDVRVYHGTVTAAEILQHSKAQENVAAEKAKLVLHFTFDDKTAKDLSGAGNKGTLGNVKAAKGKFGMGMTFSAKAARAKKKPQRQAFTHTWTQDLPLFARAMVKTGEKLVVAGPEDIVDEEKAKTLFKSPEMQERFDRQSEMIDGKLGGKLRIVAAADGSTLAEHHLDVPPVFDGMISAGGKLFVSNMNGTVVCYE